MAEWTALIPAAIQGAMGIAQYFQGRKLANTPTPDYNIPTELFDMRDTQKAAMLGEMPSATKIRQDIRGTTANQLENAERLGMLDPNMVGAAYTQEQKALSDLGATEAMYRTGEKDKFLNTQQLLANEQLQKQQWETLLPFERRMASGSALMGAGIQNAWGGLQSAGDFLMYNQAMKNYGNLLNPADAIRLNLQMNPDTQAAQKQAYRMFMNNPFTLTPSGQ